MRCLVAFVLLVLSACSSNGSSAASSSSPAYCNGKACGVYCCGPNDPSMCGGNANACCDGHGSCVYLDAGQSSVSFCARDGSTEG